MTPDAIGPVEDLLERNARFAERGQEELPQLPRLGVCVLTCPDPRVDPALVLGIELGDAFVIRAPGGRISPSVLQQLLLLRAVGAVRGNGGLDWELVLMGHTDCGIAHLAGPEYGDALAAYLGCTRHELDGKSIGDPYGAVRADIEWLAANTMTPASMSVTGLVYDVYTRRAEFVERRSPLRG